MSPEERAQGIADADLLHCCGQRGAKEEGIAAIVSAIRAAEDEATTAERERIALALMASAKIAEEMGAPKRAQALAFAALDLRRSLKSSRGETTGRGEP